VRRPALGIQEGKQPSIQYMLQDVTKSAGAGTSLAKEGSDASSSLVLFLVNTSGF